MYSYTPLFILNHSELSMNYLSKPTKFFQRNHKQTNKNWNFNEENKKQHTLMEIGLHCLFSFETWAEKLVWWWWYSPIEPKRLEDFGVVDLAEVVGLKEK